MVLARGDDGAEPGVPRLVNLSRLSPDAQVVWAEADTLIRHRQWLSHILVCTLVADAPPGRAGVEAAVFVGYEEAGVAGGVPGPRSLGSVLRHVQAACEGTRLILRRGRIEIADNDAS